MMKKITKGLFILFVILMAFGVNNMSASAEVSEEELRTVYSAYEEFLADNRYESNWTTEDRKVYANYSDYPVRFAFLDANQDGIPEMITTGKETTSDSPGYLYTYKNNMVVFVDRMDFGSGIGGEWATFYYNPTRREIVLSATTDESEGSSVYTSFSYDGVKVTRKGNYRIENYNSTLNFLEANKLLRTYQNNKEGRKLFFGVSLNKTSIRLSKTESFKLKAETSFTDEIEWTSSNENVAVVNSQGRVTAKKTGTARIIAKAGIYSVSCDIKVYCLENHKWIKKYAYGKWRYEQGEFDHYTYTMKVKKYRWIYSNTTYVTKVYKDKSKNICIMLKQPKDSKHITKFVLYKKYKYKKFGVYFPNDKDYKTKPYFIWRRCS